MKKRNNTMKTIKILTIILLIILISMIGFFGIYKQNKNQMSDTVKGYSHSMALNGGRNIKLVLSTENEDLKTVENYNKSKTIIEKRLKKLGIEEYNISLNTKTGEIIVEIPEDSKTDSIVSNINTVGKFEIIDSDTEEVLLNNDDIKSTSVLYNTSTSGTTVNLEIAFNKEGQKKLEEISKTYVHEETEDTDTEENSTEEEIKEKTTSEETTSEETTSEESKSEESTDKEITMKIDDKEIMTTHFDEPITTGKMKLLVGSTTTDTKQLQDYIEQAQNMAVVLDNGNLPLTYEIEKNQYILSDISEQQIGYLAIAISVIAVIGIIALIIKYKTKGLLAGISYVGLAALYLLLIRYTNVLISIESIFGIILVLVLNFIFTAMLLEKAGEDKSTLEVYKKFFNRIMPIFIMSVVFCFIKWVPISSFGMITFWGILMIAIYNFIVTKYLLKTFLEGK